jgi:LacI family gluconate utilization system Gnt-I transcriptional repressor
MRQARREYSQLDGIFCTNDDLAVGAAFECQRLGLKIPDDMAIAGFHGHWPGNGAASGERAYAANAWGVLARNACWRIRGESVTPKLLDLGFTLSPGGSILV